MVIWYENNKDDLKWFVGNNRYLMVHKIILQESFRISLNYFEI